MLTSVGCSFGSMSPNALTGCARSPDKRSIVAIARDVRVPEFPGSTLVRAGMKKGRRGEAVVVKGTLTGLRGGDASAGARLALTARINGLPLEIAAPNATFAGVCGACTITAAWRFDLDAAEEASPGAFLGRPLDIELIAFDYAGTALDAAGVILQASIEKKRSARASTARSQRSTSPREHPPFENESARS